MFIGDEPSERDERMLPRFERALDQAMTATDECAFEEATRSIAALGRDLAERVALLTPILRQTSPGADRLIVIERIRQIVGGRDRA